MNKKEKIYEALTNVKREYVEEAESFNFKKRRISFSRILGMAAAACLVVAVAAIAIIPKRERNPWAANAPTDAPITTNKPMETGAPDYERLAFVGREKLCDIPMVKHISVPSHSQLEGSTAEALGYLGDPAGAVGPVGLTAASDERFILLDQVCKRLFTINRDGNFSTYFLSFCDSPRAIAYLDGADPSLGDPVVSPEDATVVNDDGSQYTILDDSLRSFVGEGLIAVLDSENIRVLRLPDMELICTVSLSEQYYVYDFNYGHDQLSFADGKLYFNANSEKALAVGVAALFEKEHIGAEMLEEAPAMPQVRDVIDYTALNTEAPDGMTVSHGWIKKLQVEGWGRSWSVEADLITPIDAYDDLLLAQTAVGSNFENMRLFVGLYSSETDASCSIEIDTENRLLPAQFAMSPSGRVYMIEFCENNAQIYELEYARVIDVTDDPGVPQLLKPGAENLLYFTDLDALKAFLDSPELSDEEFEQFVSEKLDPAMGIVTKEDARAVIGRIEQIPFPMTADLEPSGFEFYFYNKSEGNYLYSIEYSMPDGGICSFFGQLEGEYSLAKDIEAYASSASPVDFEGNAFVNRLYYENFGDVQVFYADIGGRIVNAQFRNLTYDEALEALCFFAFGKASELIGNSGQPQSALASDPWYLEKAWEYAEFVNREYGFNFIKGEARFNEADMSITFTHIESEEYINPQEIWIFFDKTTKAVNRVHIYGDGSDKPEEYASMSDEELKAVFDQLDLFATYSVTREDMLQAGYTLDGTDEDYVKIAEYCGKLKAAELENAPELHFYRCIEAEVGNARRNTEASVKNSTDPVYCWVTYYFRPAYPKLFTHNTADIGCNMTLLDDAEHPGWIYFGGDVLITPTAEGWSCQLAYISGY